ncbi:hypothetical protein HL658_32365 [Azospirillum sp. RWY-5-1]|uniref:Uncharacterized protein n=1 Tax=Azospirillum oleiclasticum TaxID=2735135 RepID=A0ABX2TJV7_9PROT|nr:hypothetical protein [Azospirillum oleiclasticum]NYZ17264.1 hypothetical protein [Azospirillum oleiclasticum]NYZ23452.1 hypothetical protein [Azospirillum oleiclasticum]
MLPAPLAAHLAARELERRRAEQSAEFARQLPLHVEDPSWRMPPEDGEAEASSPLPDWATNY